MVPEKEQKLFSGAQKVQVCAGAELFVRVVTVRTVRRNAVVLVTPPPVAVTVIGKVPPDVAAVVVTFNIEEQLRLQAVCEKDPVAPDGKPATEKEICRVLPESKLPVIVSITDDPA
jgi:hypothetical protein